MTSMRVFCLRCGKRVETTAEGECPFCGNRLVRKSEKDVTVCDDETPRAQGRSPDDLFRKYHRGRERVAETVTDEEDEGCGRACDEAWETRVFGLFWAAAITYPLGIFLPLATISKHVTGRDVTADEGSMLAQGARWLMDFFDKNPTLVDEKNTFSLASGLVELLTQGQVFLFVVVLVFSVLFPLTKLAALGHVVFGNADAATRERQLARLSFWGKWSMLDVFVIALLVVSLKLGDLVDVQIHCGIYFFAASVLLTMLLTQLLHKAFPEAARR